MQPPEQLPQHATDQQHELVQSQAVDAEPLFAQRPEEHREVGVCHRRRKLKKDGRQPVR